MNTVLDHQKALEAVTADRLNRKNGFCEVPTAVFVSEVDVNMPSLPSIAFYTWQNGRTQPDLLKKADQAYSPLALSQHSTVWIRDEDIAAIKGFALDQIANPESSEQPEKRMETLRRSALVVVEDLFQHPTQENITRSTKVVGSFVYVIMKDPKAYFLLTKLSSHDPYTLQHSVGTAVNSIILARKIGITDENELQEVGLAGLLHDIGKVKVKKEIINKNGPLDELEWEEMRQHSSEGFEIVKNNPQLTERTKRAILEHHEDRFGTGYPGGLRDADLHIFSKIVCLADVFNALTTNRSYSKARTPFEAFHFIREKLSHKVDSELFRQMVLIYGGELDQRVPSEAKSG